MKKSLLLILLALLSISLAGCKKDPVVIKKDPITNCLISETLVDDVCVNTRTYYNNDSCQYDEDTNLLACFTTWSQYLHTSVSITVYFDQYQALDSEKLFDDIEEIIAYYDKTSDKYEGYDGIINVKTINDDPTATHVLDEDLFNLIQFTLDHQGEVDNLFNAALGPVLQVWHDYRENCNLNNVCTVPTFGELNALKPLTNPADVTLDENNLTITMKEGMSLDLGGVSKGYITRDIVTLLDNLDLYGYLLNNGTSNISIGGLRPKRDSGEFLIGVLDPRNEEWENSTYATVFLEDGEHLVTSGDYQQYYVADGDFYHHIIHNVTLFPERYTRSVSIVTSDPALADLYSTGIFLMELEDALAFVNNIDGLEAIWFGIDNEVYMSDNFEADHLGKITLD